MGLRERIASGSPTYGMMLSEIYVPNIIWMLARCGFEFVIVDCEHGYFDKTHVANLTCAARGAQMPLLVRVAELSETDIPQYLDMGAEGILLSNTRDAREAQTLADLCRYAPLGARGVSTFRAHTGYQSGDVAGILRAANERICVFCQIESEDAARNAEAILSVHGVDGVFIGPNDMTHRMGIFGQYTHPRMLSCIELVAQAAKETSKVSGVITVNEELLRACKERGMMMFSVGSELNYLVNGGCAALARAREL